MPSKFHKSSTDIVSTSKGSGFEWFVARRLQWRSSEHRGQSPSVAVAVAGIAVAVAVMLISVGVLSGFKNQVRDAVRSIDDDITITAFSPDGVNREPVSPTLVGGLIDLPAGAETVTHNMVSGVLKTAGDFLGVNFTANADYVHPDSVECIVLSQKIARLMQLAEGDTVPAYFVSSQRMRVRRLVVTGIYASPVDEHDRVVVYCSDSLARAMSHIGKGYAQTIGIRGIGAEPAQKIADAVSRQLIQAYYEGRTTQAYAVQPVTQTSAMFFAWLDLLDTNVVVILALMGAVAAFTLISSLFIIILERVQTIGLFKAMGASNRQVRHTFMLMAQRLVVRGLLWGNAAGLGLMLLQMYTHIVPLDPVNYYVDHVPVQLSWVGILAINIGVVALSWIVLMLPTLIIARISPAATIRYE